MLKFWWSFVSHGHPPKIWLVVSGAPKRWFKPILIKCPVDVCCYQDLGVCHFERIIWDCRNAEFQVSELLELGCCEKLQTKDLNAWTDTSIVNPELNSLELQRSRSVGTRALPRRSCPTSTRRPDSSGAAKNDVITLNIQSRFHKCGPNRHHPKNRVDQREERCTYEDCDEYGEFKL